ncbi:hypothetical protein ACIA6E_22820 [Streptomyces sp. NPDC051815]|uniref:hypothetical protein n=1 Tax=Streptomyces sp. NPDC051815 TaxID=3365674 RepID=UPI00379EAC9A
MLAIRDTVRGERVATLTGTPHGHRTLPRVARLALVGWLSAGEGTTLEWTGGPSTPGRPGRDVLGCLPVRRLRSTLAVIEEFVPECPAPPAPEERFDHVSDLAPVTGRP